MTIFNKDTDLPLGINTIERLFVWAGLALVRTNPSGRILEIPGANPERVADFSFFVADDNSIRMAIRVSTPIDPSYAEGGDKFWNYALEISNTELPSDFKSD